MHPSIAEKRDQIRALCRRFRVRRLEIFGSAARGGDFDPLTSDADFLVEFDTDPTLNAFDAYFELRQALASLLDRDVDLVSAAAIRNPYLRDAVNRSRELVHGA